MKKYYLYRQPILKSVTNGAKLADKGDWYFDDEFDSYDDAYHQAELNASNSGSWKVWKIEEVLVFN